MTTLRHYLFEAIVLLEQEYKFRNLNVVLLSQLLFNVAEESNDEKLMKWFQDIIDDEREDSLFTDELSRWYIKYENDNDDTEEKKRNLKFIEEDKPDENEGPLLEDVFDGYYIKRLYNILDYSSLVLKLESLNVSEYFG